MNILKACFFSLILSCCLNINVNAQVKPRIPEESSTQIITQNLGLGTISITYSRPNVKGRKIFGGIQPMGEVWRTGANWATTITFSDTVTVQGHKVPAGIYSLFTIPGEKQWTIILNTNPKQWGAYTYKPEDDFLRFTVPVINLKEKRETFTIAFANVTTKDGEVYLLWDYTAVAFKLHAEDDRQILANIDTLMQGDEKPYFNAIQYYYENNKDLNKAMVWVKEAQKKEPDAPWFKLWEARILLKQGKKAAAIKAAKQGIALSKESSDDEYERLNQGVIDMANQKDQ